MLITASNIEKQYGERELFSVNSLIIEENSFVHLTGENGSGKSTFLRILAGHEPLSRGILTYNNEKEYFRNLLFLSPKIGFYGPLTPKENITFFYNILHPQKKKTESKSRITEYLDLLSIDKNIPFERLSSGEKQKTLLAFTAFLKPKYLLLDEPLNHLDDQAKSIAIDLIKDTIMPASTFIIITSHSEDLSFLKNKWEIKNQTIEMR